VSARDIRARYPRSRSHLGQRHRACAVSFAACSLACIGTLAFVSLKSASSLSMLTGNAVVRKVLWCTAFFVCFEKIKTYVDEPENR
jgi:hypothetical protein